MKDEGNHFRKGIAVSLSLHMLAVLFVFVLGAGKSGAPRLERSIEVSLRSYEPKTAERESRAERKKRPRPAEKAKAPAKRPAKAKKSSQKPKTAKKPPAVEKKPAAEKKPETVKKPEAARKPPEKKASEKPPQRPGPPERKEKPRAPEKPKPPEKKEPAPAVEPSPPLEEKRAPAPEPPTDRKKEVLRDMRKESVIRSLREVPGEKDPAPQAQGAPDQSPGEPAAPQDAPEPPAREKKESAGEAASEPALESVRKNPEGEGARRAPEEKSPRVLSLVLDVYYKAISRQIEKNLILPLNVEPRGFMTALVSFRMKPGGEVYDVEISEGSGNDVFDFYCIKAVNASSPLPAPPGELRERISAEPFVVPCKNSK